MSKDIIFSVFDLNKGPIILFSSLESNEDSKKIAVRSFIAIGAMEEDQDLSGRHAVVPIHSLDKIAFYYMFKVKKKNGETDKRSSPWAILGFLEKSSEKISFYRSIPILEKSIVPVVELIQKTFIYEGYEMKITPALIKKINDLRSLKPSEIIDTSPSLTMPGQESIELPYEDFKAGDLSFLFDYFPQDLDRVIYSLMLEEPILIVGDIKDIVQKVVASIEFLVPHRLLTKKYLTAYRDPKGEDILVCSSNANYIKKYKGITIVNVVSRKISSRVKGVPSVSDLISTLKIAPKGTQEKVIKVYIDKLLAKTAELMQLCEKAQIDREEIQIFRGDLKSDELNIVISMVRRYAPQFEGKLFYFARSLI